MEYKDRKKDIVEILYEKGKITVSELANALFVTEMTIRRDLIELEKSGVVKRYRGGAVLNAMSSEMPVSQRFFVSQNEKIDLAKRAASFLDHDMVVFIDSSSTCQYIIPYVTRFKNVTVITNSVNALLMASKSKIPCILIGGNYCDRDMCFTGTIAEQYARQFNVDVAFFSCLGLSKEGVISDHDVEQSTIRKIMLGQSKKNIFLFEGSKLNKTYFYTVCKRDEVDEVIVST